MPRTRQGWHVQQTVCSSPAGPLTGLSRKTLKNRRPVGQRGLHSCWLLTWNHFCLAQTLPQTFWAPICF